MIRLAFGALVLALGLLSAEVRADEPPPFVPREAVLRLSPGTPPLAVVPAGTVVLESITSRDIHRYRVPVGLDELEWIDLVDDDARVLSAELNYIAEDTNPDGGTQSIFILQVYGDYLAQDAIDTVGADLAATRASGAGVLVAVVDSGIDPQHALFRGKLIMGVIDLINPTGSGLDVGDGLDNDGDLLIDEMVGHGTLVAGIVLRVAPQAAILPIRVLDSDGGSTSFRLADGIYTAIDRGADIINISLGTVAESSVLADAVSAAIAADRLVVASAGNDDTDQFARFPAGFSDSGVLSITATRADDLRAPFGNFGGSISLSAPGDPVVGAVPGGGYGSASGTSFSAPIVSGTAALLRSITPCVPMVQVRQRLLETAVDIDPLNPDYAGKLGSGRVDAAAALGVGGPQVPFSADINRDRRVDIEDLYLIHTRPRDVNGDGLVNLQDRRAVEAFVRRFESLETRRR